MPVHVGKDSKGCFAQWGGQKKYYYTCDNVTARDGAKTKAAKQGAAAHAAGYKGNAMLRRIKANFVGKVRHDEMEGREYLVAPMIMIVEGVHDANEGPLLYPAKELKKNPAMWNHRPIVVYHPEKNGEPVSACDPVILSNRKVGVIMNTKFIKTANGPGLKAEAWLEPDRMDVVDERIADAIEKNQMMELSTGLFTDNESESGEWNGEPYVGITHNYRPDHLALLPDLKGACSIEDGAGFLRLNARPDKIVMVSNEMSHGNVRSLLNSWLQDKDDDVWVEDVYDDFFIFMKDGKLFKGTYSIVNNAIEIVDTFEEVVRVTEYRTRDGEFVGNKDLNIDRKERAMDKEKIIDALIESNSNSWDKKDRKTLTAMNEDVLEKLQSSEKLAAEKAVENAAKEAAEAEAKEATEKVEAEAKEVKEKAEAEAVGAGNKNKKPETLQEYIAKAPLELRPVLQNQMTSYEATKTALVKRLTDNEKCPFTEEQLKVKDVGELRKLVALAFNEEESDDAASDFSGQGLEPTAVANVETPLEMPVVMGAEVAAS